MEAPNSTRSSGLPAPYGQACATCARAKSRCIYRTGRHDCDRCHRLGKQCVISSSVRRRGGKRVAEPRPADLEEKAEGIVALLQSQAADKPELRAALTGLGISTPAPSEHSSLESAVARDASTRPSTRDGNRDTTYAGGISVILSRPGSASHPILSRKKADRLPSVISSPIEPYPAEAEECLEFFREHFLNFCPFIYFPPTTTARRLRETYPFLWFNIMAITIKPGLEDFAMTDDIKRFVAQSLVVDNMKNIDLLLGLLVYMCWFHYHRKDRSRATVMSALATSLVFDMGLNKEFDDPPRIPCDANNRTTVFMLGPAKSMIERRAVLAHFLITSQVAYAKKTIDTLAWTPHMDKCLRVVSENPEWPGDERLVAQVKIQLIFDQMGRGPWAMTPDNPPPTSYIDALNAHIERLRQQLPPALSSDDTISSELLYAQIALQDFSITRTPNPPPHHPPSLSTHLLLSSHLASLTAWLSLFFTTPPSALPGVPFLQWCKLGHVMMLLHRLCTLDCHDAGRPDVDLVGLSERAAGMLEEAGARRRDGRGAKAGDAFGKLADLFRAMRGAWGMVGEVGAASEEGVEFYRMMHERLMGGGGERAGNGASEDSGAGAAQQVSVPLPPPPPPLPSSFQLAAMSEDAWLNDIFNVTW